VNEIIAADGGVGEPDNLLAGKAAEADARRLRNL
jgi:hypothetical protein